jgi:hypothetical protein
MNDDVITEYVDLCEQLAATELLDNQTAEAQLYDRLDELWYTVMTDDEHDEAEDRLVAKARAWHDARRAVDA